MSSKKPIRLKPSDIQSKSQPAKEGLIEPFSAKTQGQKEYVRSMVENDITICHGLAGTGKTLCSIGLACQYLMTGRIGKILVSRSIIGCDNEIGALPGNVDEKIQPYFYAYLDYVEWFIGKYNTQRFIEEGLIEFTPVELLRGRTYKNTFMILDEAQSTTIKQLKLFISRIGDGSKIVLIGDTRQSDIKNSGFHFCIDKLVDIENVRTVELGPQDVLRHPIIPKVMRIFDDNY